MWPSKAFLCILLFVGSQGCSPQKDAVRLSCPDDIELVAGKNSASADVSWTANDFEVDSSHQIKGLYQIVPVHGASATFERTFSEGRHFVEYKAVDSSGNHGDCSFTVTVKVVRCLPLPPSQFGLIKCDGPSVYGTRCSIECVSGYVPVGSESECRIDGTWSHDPAYCRVTTCSDPGTPLFGHRKCSTPMHAYGSICEFDCSHGYQLRGNRRIVCQTIGNRTQWSEGAPTCQEIIPPKPESCPASVVTRVAASGTGAAEVQLPRILFRAASGTEAPFVCSHYGLGSRSRNFSIGLHSIRCTATDPELGEAAKATCAFDIRVKANPCQPLAQPINGMLLCSGSHGGGDSVQRTSCRLFCNRGHVLPRPASSSSAAAAAAAPTSVFECGHSGSWQPSSFVPSCVAPSRPSELKLPAELLYWSSNCSNSTHQSDFRTHFQAVLFNFMRTHSACAMNPGDCIVEDVSTDCRMITSSSSSTSQWDRRRRRRRHSRQQHDQFVSTTFARRRSGTVRRHLANQRAFRLSVKFLFATRLPSTGAWPDEYHRASSRLYSIFDYFKHQVDSGAFSITHRIHFIDVDEVNGSVKDAPMRATCGSGYDFNRDFLLCVPCGAGTYFNNSLDRCVRCPEGTHQVKQAQRHCN